MRKICGIRALFLTKSVLYWYCLKVCEGVPRASFHFARKGAVPMPYRPKKPCAHPGCPALTYTVFCPAHEKQDARAYEKYKRDPATRKRYGRAWQHIRTLYIAAHPLCEQCAADGRLTPAREVHHVIPLADGGSHDDENLIALCKACHSGITRSTSNRCHKGP